MPTMSSLKTRLRYWLGLIQSEWRGPEDLPCDFESRRAGQILRRARVMAFLAGLVTLGWVPIDLWLKGWAEGAPIAGVRGILAFGFFYMARHACRCDSDLREGLRAILTIQGLGIVLFLAPILTGAGTIPSATVYAYIPFVLVAASAVFPVTPREGVMIQAPALGIGAGTWVMAGQTPIGPILFGPMAMLAGVALWIQHVQIQTLAHYSRAMAFDALTQIPNRGHIERRLDKLTGEAEALSVLLLDVDNFKAINDEWGHTAGDVILHHMASTLRKSIRQEDEVRNEVGRYGGEEFIVVAAETDLAGALRMAERVRGVIEAAPAATKAGIIPITVSIGVAQYHADEVYQDVMARADEALYRAKTAGRNRVAADRRSTACGDLVQVPTEAS